MTQGRIEVAQVRSGASGTSWAITEQRWGPEASVLEPSKVGERHASPP